MTNYSVIFLAVAFIAGSLYGVKTILHVPASNDNVLVEGSLRRRLLYDPRTVVLKTPDYALSQNAAGRQQSDVNFRSQVLEAEAETAELLARQQKKGGGGMPLREQQQGMTVPTMSQQLEQMGSSSLNQQQQPQQLQNGGASSLIQQEPLELQGMGSSSMMQQQPQQLKGMGSSSMMQQQPQQSMGIGASSMMQQEPQELKGMGASSMMQQQEPQQIQEIDMSSMTSQEHPIMMQQGSKQNADHQQQSQAQFVGGEMSQRGVDPLDPAVSQIGQGDQQQQSSDNKKLEFVHITKSGGSAIEAAAAKHNIMWSACHYWKIPYLGCTTPDWEIPKKRLVERMPAGLVYQGEPWHAPPHWNVPNMLEGSDTFVVVRNPYERIVSEYYCSAFGYKGEDRENPEVFNRWLSGNLTLLETKLQGHMLPQNYYVYDENGNKVVTHILRYENLQPEFDALMERYNLPVRMPSKNAKSVFHYKVKNGKKSAETITVNSISPENIERINRSYGRDFEFFGYPMITVTPSMSEGQGGMLSPDSTVDLSRSAGAGAMDGSMSSLSQTMGQDSLTGQQPVMGQQEQGMMRQDASGSMLSSTTQQMMGQNANDIMPSRSQQQPQMRMGQIDSTAGQQQDISSQQQIMSQDARGSMLTNGGQQQQSMSQYTNGMVADGGQQQVVDEGGMMAGTSGQQQMMGQDANGMMSSLGQQQGMGSDSSGRMAVPGVLQEQAPLSQDGRGGIQRSNAGQQQQSMERVDNGMTTSSSQGRTSNGRSGSPPLAGVDPVRETSMSSGIDGSRQLMPDALLASSMATTSKSGSALPAHVSNRATSVTPNLRTGN